MRLPAAVLALALLPASSLAVGGAAMASGMGFCNPDVGTGQNTGPPQQELVSLAPRAHVDSTPRGLIAVGPSG